MTQAWRAWDEPIRRFIGPDGQVYHLFEAPVEQSAHGQVRSAHLHMKTIVVTTAEGRWIGRAFVGLSLRLESFPIEDFGHLLEAARDME